MTKTKFISELQTGTLVTVREFFQNYLRYCIVTFIRRISITQ